ncbi:hypothetical protein GCM10010483_55130 [Actinokineospora diospyrosa]
MRVVIAAVAAVMVPFVVGAIFKWDGWITAVVIAVLLGAVAVVAPQVSPTAARLRGRPLGDRRFPEPVVVPPPAPAPPPPGARTLTSVRLPSAIEDIPFTLTCTVRWYPRGQGHPDPGALAVQSVISRARQLTHLHHPQDSGAVHALAAELSTPGTDSGNAVQAWATEVNLTVGEEHDSYLRNRLRLGRQRQLAQLEIDNERFLRGYLTEEVLTSAGSTVVWWLAKDSTKVRETVDLIGPLAQLSAAANDREVDRAFRALVPGSTWSDNGHSLFVVDSPTTNGQDAPDLLPDPDDDNHALFGRDLVILLDRHGHSDLAAKARQRYGVDDWSAAGAEPVEQPGPED